VDIKDFILVGGGLLIAAVVAHGFWIAWRARREPLRLDIAPNMYPENVEDIEWLRGELPNGGARVIQTATSGEQESLFGESAPVLLEPSEHEVARTGPVEPSLDPIVPQKSAAADAVFEPATGRDLSSEGLIPETPDIDEEPMLAPSPSDELAAAATESGRAKVAGVVIPQDQQGFVPDARIDSAYSRDVAPSPVEPVVAEPGQDAAAQMSEPVVAETQARQPRRPRRLAAKPEIEPVTPAEPAPVEELLILNVLAPDGSRFTGAELFAALRGRGLKFGNMNIFHRVDPLSKIVQYSVANVVEPGTFDVADMDEFRSPGLCFFLQLPGPEHPADVLEDMFEVASSVSADLRGELKDEQRNFLTPQMVEHYRQRIMDYTRRRLSKRA